MAPGGLAGELCRSANWLVEITPIYGVIALPELGSNPRGDATDALPGASPKSRAPSLVAPLSR